MACTNVDSLFVLADSFSILARNHKMGMRRKGEKGRSNHMACFKRPSNSLPKPSNGIKYVK